MVTVRKHLHIILRNKENQNELIYIKSNLYNWKKKLRKRLINRESDFELYTLEAAFIDLFNFNYYFNIIQEEIEKIKNAVKTIESRKNEN